jgi:hypothetical protein
MSSYCRLCRICRGYGPDLEAFALRHYAHASCLVRVRGWAWILSPKRSSSNQPAFIYRVARAVATEALALGYLSDHGRAA